MIQVGLLAILLLCVSRSEQHLHNQTTNCGLLGPRFPQPSNLHETTSIRTTATSFGKILSDAIESSQSPWGELDRADTSFSVGVFTTGTDDFLFEHHHVGQRLAGSLTGGSLDEDSLYRIGSVTKLLTVYTILAHLGYTHWDEPITSYIPELRIADPASGHTVRHIDWSEVTLGALASHSAGIPRDDGFIDLSNFGPLVKLGFPALMNPPACESPAQPACAREEALKLILQQIPVTSTFSSPIYSNEACQLLGLAVENITGESFADTFKQEIMEYLGLSRTFWSPPLRDDSTVNVSSADPINGYSFNYDLGTYNPTGGVATSLDDLSTIGRSILRSELLPKSLTRKWLKPVAHTGSLYSAIGRPWEITRMEVSVPPSHEHLHPSESGRLVDLYTKNGGVGAYESYLILSPDHNPGISILLASNLTRDSGRAGLTMKTISEMATSVWVTAAEAAAREEAEGSFAGGYIAEHQSTEDALTQLARAELAMIPGRQGLSVTHFSYNGTDMLSLLRTMVGFAGADLHYMGISSGNEVSFRAIWSRLMPRSEGEEENVRASPDDKTTYPKTVLNRVCASTWGGIDMLKYGNYGLDHFVFTTDDGGEAIRLELPALRVILFKETGHRSPAVHDHAAMYDDSQDQQPI